MTEVDPRVVELASRPLLRGAIDGYWPVLVTAVIFGAFMVVSLEAKDMGTWRKTVLATGVSWIVYAWAFLTVFEVHGEWTTGGHAFSPHDVIRIGLEASVCLFAILLLLIPRNLLSRRIKMPTAFTLGIGAAIAAAYGDLLLFLWAATPLR